METAIPALLPPIDEVAVVDLAGLGVWAGSFVAKSAGAPTVKLVGADAIRIADLWRALPPGEQVMCHIPPFGLRFYAAGRIVCQASICWRCDNIYGEAGGDAFSYAFDGSHALARELLSMLEQAVGHPAAED